MKTRFFLLTMIACLVLSFSAQAQDKDPEKERKVSQKTRDEEVEDYFRKWLEEDVVYILNSEEKAVFEKLTTPEEKDNFIEQFWARRDPDPRTIENEFREEHYRRIAYANERFTSGDPGWRTDRGRIYIVHGEPDSIESRPDGGTYIRPIEEGGGYTSVHPYEKWRYRYIEGIGNDVELEFVDPSHSGEFRLAVFPWEKDALTQIGGEGPTLAEQTRLARRRDRPALMPAAGGAGYGPESMFMRARDTPFARYELFARVGAPPITRYKDLKEMVEVKIDYSSLPFEVHKDYFKLNENQVLVPITVQVRNQDLNFKAEGGRMVAKLAIYGMVSTMTNRFVVEFEDDVVTGFSEADLNGGLEKSSVYQKVLTLDAKMKHKIDLVVRDLNSGEAGILREAISPPRFEEVSLRASSLILSDQLEALDEIPDGDEMFVLGDVKIIPNLTRKFASGMPLGVYLQVYNAALDQTTLEPSLRVEFKLYRDGTLLAAAVDENGESTQFFSTRRVVLLKNLSLAGLEPAKYRVEVVVSDLLSDAQITLSERFELMGNS